MKTTKCGAGVAVEQDGRVFGLPFSGEDEGKVIQEGGSRSEVQAIERDLFPHRRRYSTVLKVCVTLTALFQDTSPFLHVYGGLDHGWST